MRRFRVDYCVKRSLAITEALRRLIGYSGLKRSAAKALIRFRPHLNIRHIHDRKPNKLRIFASAKPRQNPGLN